MIKPKARDYDLVECFGGEFGWMTRRLAKSKPRPLIVAHTDGLELLQAHLTARFEGSRSIKDKLTAPLHRWLDWSAFQYADGLVAGCEADIRFAQTKGLFKTTNAKSINVGVDLDYLGIPFQSAKEHLVIYFGTWSQRKAPDRIVRVMTQVLARHAECKFEVLGASGAAQEIMGSFDIAFRDRIRVHSKLPACDVASTLLRAKVIFLPSHYEGFGMATSEAMGCSCAAVLTPTGFGADLHDGVDAMVRDFDDESGMVENILTLLTNDAFRGKIARAGWERIQRLSWQNQCQKLAETYTRWLAAWDAQAGCFKNSFPQ